MEGILKQEIRKGLSNAMAKTYKPSIEEMLGGPAIGLKPSKRGKKMLKSLKKAGIDRKKFIISIVPLLRHFEYRNVLVLGVKDGKIVFMPLVDVI